MRSTVASASLDWAGFAWPVEGLGPGRRVALWVRGCRLACPGCMSPELWSSSEPVSVESIAEQLAKALTEADGLTISGGEPMDQAAGLLALTTKLRLIRNDLEVLCYSGYKLEDLRRREDCRALLAELDMLIDGPYMQHLPSTLAWRGSDNQRLHLLSERARERYAHLAEALWCEPRPLTLQHLAADSVRLIGIPRRGDLERYRETLGARGIMLNKPDVTR
jgi:anaerobic ribonucleoside-triphosphate reductase activating protein